MGLDVSERPDLLGEFPGPAHEHIYYEASKIHYQ